MSSARREVLERMINATSNAIAYLHNFGDENPHEKSKLLHLLNSYYSLFWVFREDLEESYLRPSDTTTRGDN